ncbi:hypothetical protein Q7P37_002027 [Cladosporium fusiforme]
MADWIQQYTAALEARDVREQAHRQYIDAYTALADRTASQLSSQPTASMPSSPNPQASIRGRTSTPTKEPTTSSPAPTTDLLSALRADLTSTQKARTALQTQLSTLTTQLSSLSTQQRASQAQITALSKQKLDAERKLRDRDEELRGKSKLVEQAQDEMVALGLQLNLAEQRSEKLESENKELVERWMKRMGEEAEKVNRDSRWE